MGEEQTYTKDIRWERRWLGIVLGFGDDHGSQLVIPMYKSAPQLTRVADLLSGSY